MRTTEDERVHPGPTQGDGVAAGDLFCHLAVPPAFFNEGHEKRARPRSGLSARTQSPQDLRIGAGAHGRLGTDDADAAAARGGKRGARAGLDDADDGDLHGPADGGQGHGRGGVAGDYQELDALGRKETRDFDGITRHGLWRLGAVGDVRRIAKIHQGLPGHAARQGPENGQAAKTRVEDPDRRARRGFPHSSHPFLCA